jgi:SAM-dependent methyltransferase
MKNPKVEYVGKDLEAMDFAENYHRWILDVFRPYLGSRLVEVGAGTGSFSTLLLETSPAALAVVEPSGMFESLKQNLSCVPAVTEVTFVNSVFTESVGVLRESVRPDTLIYINVLEHIEDDAAELAEVFKLLPPGGHLCIFVPALEMLFSKFDRHIGHFRRYSKGKLLDACGKAGFDVLLAKNFDALGVLPWLLKYRMLGSLKMEPAAVAAYDRFAVPFVRRFETIVSPPFGKNLILVARKPH